MAFRRLTAITLALGLLLASPVFASLLEACPKGGLFSLACPCQEGAPSDHPKFERRAGCCCELAAPTSATPVVLGGRPPTTAQSGPALSSGPAVGLSVPDAFSTDVHGRGPPAPSRTLFIDQRSLLL
ncbi:MAG: hypothetical protein VCB80_00810 [Deltaproteobacteria bacterium]